MAEIGVFGGAFSRQILDRVRPSQLVPTDFWADEDVMSGDVDGRDERRVNGRAHKHVDPERFEALPGVRVDRGTSDCPRFSPNSYFDAISIDADLAHGAVRSELFDALRASRAGRWLMDRDYGQNREPTDTRRELRVKTAVDDFCNSREMEIDSFGVSRLASFANHVRKEGCLVDSGACRSRRMATDVQRLLRSAASRLRKTVAG